MNGDRNQEELIRLIQDRLEAEPNIELAILYGSLDGGAFRSDSDIDIAVAAGPDFGVAAMAEISGALEALSGHPVDVLNLRSAEGLILSEAISGRVLVENTELRHRLTIKALYFREDYLPIINRERRASVERFINEA